LATVAIICCTNIATTAISSIGISGFRNLLTKPSSSVHRLICYAAPDNNGHNSEHNSEHNGDMTLAYLQGATVVTSRQCSTSTPPAPRGRYRGSRTSNPALRKLTLTGAMVLCQPDSCTGHLIHLLATTKCTGTAAQVLSPP
jgi:hypothetical protein